jgi:hypothetical protein
VKLRVGVEFVDEVVEEAEAEGREAEGHGGAVAAEHGVGHLWRWVAEGEEAGVGAVENGVEQVVD